MLQARYTYNCILELLQLINSIYKYTINFLRNYRRLCLSISNKKFWSDSYLRVNSWMGLSCRIRVSSSCRSRWCIILLISATLCLNSSSSSRWVWVLLDKSCRYPSWLACSRGNVPTPPLVRPVPPAFLCPSVLSLPDPVVINSPSFLAISIVWVVISSATCSMTPSRWPWNIWKFPLVNHGKQEIRIEVVQGHWSKWGFD